MSKLTPGHLLNSTELGRRDAFHSPAVAVKTNEPYIYINEGVRFVDDSLKIVRRLFDNDEKPHAIVDPFLEKNAINQGDVFWVFIVPGIVNNLVHSFNVNLDISDKEKSLYTELEKQRQNDPNCAGCWVIENGKIIRY